MIPALVSALLAGAFVWMWRRGREAGLAERLRGKEDELLRLGAELAALRVVRDELAARTAALEAGLAAELAAHERLVTEFKSLSADALRANRTDFLDQAKQAFAQLQLQSTGDLDQRKQAVESLVKPLRESLEKVDQKMSDFEKNRASAYGALGEQLKTLSASQLLWQNEAARLSTALRSTSFAGSWGELQLRRVVEMADMLPYCDFGEQESAGGLRADLVVRLPGGQRIVVDAKTPLDAYRAAVETTDEAARTAHLAEHAQKVRGHIDALGAKNYWEQFQPAPEFVVLFLPGDHFLTAALQADRMLMDRALARRVLLATPTTLIALLKAASYGWRQESASRNAEEVTVLGRQLYDRIVTFADNFDRVGRGLDSAVKSFNATVGSLEQTLIPGARRFAELGVKGAKDLTAPAPVDTAVREVAKKA
jgi:DNA recombination protein RmuC